MSVSLLHTRADPYVPYGSALAVWLCKDREILNDGPARTGKSRGNMEKALACALNRAGSRQFFARATRESMNATILHDFEREVLPPAWRPKGAVEGRTKYVFPNGSEIAVIGMNKISNLMSSEFDRGFIFEATEVDVDQYEYLNTRLSGKLDGCYKQLVADCNPDSKGHHLWQRYESGAMTRINSRHEDNPRWFNQATGEWTPEGVAYIASLDRLTGFRKARLRFGLWVGAEGMIFEEWDQAVHVIKRRDLPSDYRNFWRVRSVDFGFKDPFVCLWAAIDEDGRIYIDREYVRTRKTVRKHAKALIRLTESEEDIQFTVADHDAEDRATLEEGGIDTLPAIKPKKASGKNWIAQLDQVRERLSPWKGSRPGLFYIEDALADTGGPDAQMREDKLPCGLLEEITQYVWEETKPGQATKEKPRDGNDHSVEALRNLVVAANLWFDGKLERPKKTYPKGTWGEALGMNDEDD